MINICLTGIETTHLRSQNLIAVIWSLLLGYLFEFLASLSIGTALISSLG